jgi:hypothetical protein
MAIICPKCGRKVISLNFNYCLYCKEPFDDELMRLIQDEKSKVDKEAAKEFIRLQYEHKQAEKLGSAHLKHIKLITVAFLVLVAIGVLFIASKILLVSSRMNAGGYSGALSYSAIPITVVMLALIVFMIYRILR